MDRSRALVRGDNLNGDSLHGAELRVSNAGRLSLRANKARRAIGEGIAGRNRRSGRPRLSSAPRFDLLALIKKV